jgi:hypothetical protein
MGAVRVGCTEPEFARIVFGRDRPIIAASVSTPSPAILGSSDSAFKVRNGRRRLGVGQRSRGGHLHVHSAYAAKPHAEQRHALHSHFLKRHLGWDLGR